jgi:hypothetical protein
MLTGCQIKDTMSPLNNEEQIPLTTENNTNNEGKICLNTLIENVEFTKTKIEKEPYTEGTKTKYEDIMVASANYEGYNIEIKEISGYYIEEGKTDSYYYEQSFITINGVTTEGNFSVFHDAVIIDLDKNDNYKELVIFDGGPSDDPCFEFYRLVNDKIIYLGSLNGVIEECYKEGNVYTSSLSYIPLIEEQVIWNYAVLRDDKFELIYKFANGEDSFIEGEEYISGSFKNQTFTSNGSCSFYYVEGKDDPLTIPEGEKIKILKIYEYGDTYLIQRENGEEIEL